LESLAFRSLQAAAGHRGRVRVCLGGTFDVLHEGHRLMLAKAFDQGEHVFIGLTGQEMASRTRTRRVHPFSRRMKALQRLLAQEGWTKRATVAEINDAFGASTLGDYDAIVVSAETRFRVDAINKQRRKRGLKRLRVFEVPYAYAQDGIPISATRIRAGDIDASGRRRKPLRVAVGTANRLKRDAVADAFARVFPGFKSTVRAFDVASGVPEQPMDADTAAGALLRAEAALGVWKNADYGVGVEAGLVRDPFLGRMLDVQYCAVIDRRGTASAGHGGGFYYPDAVTDKVLAGATVSHVLGPIAGDARIGSTTGAIGWLTRGAIERKELTVHGVLMALVPRARAAAYDPAAGRPDDRRTRP
jgi:inosine/xanthosine triphosphatase